MSEKVDASSTGDSALSKDGAGAAKAVIKNVDMSEEMQQEAVDIASAALEKYNIEKDIAAQIKKEFDKRFGATWHVVVGKNFGSYVTHGECLSCWLDACWVVVVVGWEIVGIVGRDVVLTTRCLRIFLRVSCSTRAMLDAMT